MYLLLSYNFNYKNYSIDQWYFGQQDSKNVLIQQYNYATKSLGQIKNSGKIYRIENFSFVLPI